MEMLFGIFRGKAIRKARKEGQCEYWCGREGRCQHIIAKGERYIDGDVSHESLNPFASERYCFGCVGPEAQASVLVNDARVFTSEALWMSGNGNTIAARNAAHDSAHFAIQALALCEVRPLGGKA